MPQSTLPCTLARAAALALMLCAGTAARANDRPFQVARTAVMEDDEQVWSFETWTQRYGSVRGLSFEPEYSFDTANSVQVEFTRLLDRHGEATGHEVEIEFKHLFNNIARDGWGWGVSAALSAERLKGGDGTARSIGLKLPLSIALGESAFLHLNVGIDKTRGERRSWMSGAAIEHKLTPRTLLFAELARDDGTRFAQVGVRHWLRRERLAVDFSLQQQRSDERRMPGFILGLGWYDL